MQQTMRKPSFAEGISFGAAFPAAFDGAGAVTALRSWGKVGSALRFTMNHYSPILKYQPYVGIGQVIGYNVGPQGD